MDPFSLAGRTALVTGGSRGIGGAIVELFARHGAKLALCHYGDETGAETLCRKLAGQGFQASATACDVANEDEVAALAAWARAELGQVDILVN
ncbi:MAG TPA: SDR family NAD(P)-dependent oxidoreductase, partial [Geminicoccus sp.]|uniref:SDR family NAD(P)-dependent oxidoreductase n=1 Tax=Geminicoccus sp. TaxID=2024832 RepID=UPI002BE321D6